MVARTCSTSFNWSYLSLIRHKLYSEARPLGLACIVLQTNVVRARNCLHNKATSNDSATKRRRETSSDTPKTPRPRENDSSIQQAAARRGFPLFVCSLVSAHLATLLIPNAPRAMICIHRLVLRPVIVRVSPPLSVGMSQGKRALVLPSCPRWADGGVP